MFKYDINGDISYCLGTSLTIEALRHKAKYLINIVVSSKIIKNKQYELLLELANSNKIEIKEDDILINKLSSKENCYCIGFFKKFYSNLDKDNQIVINKYTNLQELGTIIRSCVSFNIFNIALIDTNLDYFDPICVRTSVGAIFSANIKKYNSLEDYLKDNSNNLYFYNNDSNLELKDVNFKKNYSLLFNFNDKSDFYISHCDKYELPTDVAITVTLANLFTKS